MNGRIHKKAAAAKRPAEKIDALMEIYRRHEGAAAPFAREAICAPGCGYCCTHYGPLDITTLEGLVIRRHLARFNGRQQVRLAERIRKNRQAKEQGAAAVCPFLDDEHRCRIYDVRPFSCRQLYSLRPCEGVGPTLHRKAVALANETVLEIQRLDDTGYSGHLTFILALLEDRRFRKRYTTGGYEPARTQSFGQSHGIVINRRVSPPETLPEPP